MVDYEKYISFPRLWSHTQSSFLDLIGNPLVDRQTLYFHYKPTLLVGKWFLVVLKSIL